MRAFFSMDGSSIRLHIMGAIMRLTDREAAQLGIELAHFLQIKTKGE